MRARAAGWILLAVVAQAVQLQLIWAGVEVRYQHWRLALGSMSPGDAWRFALLGLQAAIVLVAGRNWISGAGRWLWVQFGPLRLACLAAALAVLSISPQKSLKQMLLEMALACSFMVVQAINAALAVNEMPAGSRKAVGARFLAWLDRDSGIAAAAVWVAVTAAVLSLTVWERHPHIADEAAYYFQARYFAEGLVRAPAPQVPEAFGIYLIPCGVDGCYSVFPPGWPAVLAAGMRLGAPWLVNPLLGGLNVFLLYWLLGELYDRRTAKLAALLGAVSPWQIYMAMNFMSHTFVLTCGLAAGIGCARVWSGGRIRWAALAGAALGTMSLARPLDAFALAGVAGIWLLLSGRGARGVVPASIAAACAAATGALVFPYNAAITGRATDFPVMSYMNSVFGPGANELGFGPNRGGPAVWGAIDAFPGHTPLEAAINAYLNANAIHTELVGWGTGSLLVALILLLSRWSRRRDWWMLTPVAAIAGWYSLYYFAGGPDFGSRYWFLMLPSALALSARGLLELEARTGHGALPAAAILSAIALAVFMPWRATDKYYRYCGMGAEMRERLAAGEFRGGLVLIRGTEQGDYSSARVYNPIHPANGETVFAHDRSPDLRQRLIDAFAGRPVWLVDGPSLTGSGYRAAPYPVPPRQPHVP
jgi:hypothetical protein